MPMDRPPFSSSSSDGSQFTSSSSSPAKGSSTLVLSIECLKGSSKADEWTGDMLQTGDIVEELRIGNMVINSPFKNGKSGVHRILHNSYKQKETSIQVRVRRGYDEFAELQACIVPGDKRQYVLRAIDDPNYAVGFTDRMESECFALQASRTSRMMKALERTPLQDGYVSYSWSRNMNQKLSIPNSSSFYSILFLPKSSDLVSSGYNDLEDTLARANTWINASQSTGVPIVFMNIQTESLLTKVSASSTVTAGSLSDLANLSNTSLYGFEDYHGVDIGVVRAVRLWFSPFIGEIPIEIRIKETDTKLGFAISRTPEGFIYISSVIDDDEEDDLPSSRSGLGSLYRQALKSSHLLVISRISNQKVLPWMVSSTGAIRCFDTVSMSQKLSLHRHTRLPIILHIFLWDRRVTMANVGSIRARALSSNPPSAQTEFHQAYPLSSKEDDKSEEEQEDMVFRNTAGEVSFRFHDFDLKNPLEDQLKVLR